MGYDPEYGEVLVTIKSEEDYAKTIVYNELDNDDFIKNDEKRCFYCRDELSEKLLEFARLNQINTIVDGTQNDDIGDYRPGIDALHGHGIRSPLLETKFWHTFYLG